MSKHKKQKNRAKYQQSNYSSLFSSKHINHAIKDRFDNNKLSLFLVNQSSLDAITAICQPVAQGSEFQIHYRALVVRIKSDTLEFILTIPTLFYNFKQSVSTSSVHYHLSDIDNVAKSLQNISHEKCNELLSLPIFHAIQSLPFDIDIYESNCGSIHRHPGRFGFSSIDLNKDPSDPGVVYRNKNATDFIQTDSIIYINTQAQTELFLSESRVVDVATDNDYTSGSYTEIPTLSAILQTESAHNIYSELLGESISTVDNKYIFKGDISFSKYFLVQEILKAYAQSEFKADISSVIADNITQHRYSFKPYHIQNKTSKTTKHSNYYEKIWGEYEQSLLDDPFYYNDLLF